MFIAIVAYKYNFRRTGTSFRDSVIFDGYPSTMNAFQRETKKYQKLRRERIASRSAYREVQLYWTLT